MHKADLSFLSDCEIVEVENIYIEDFDSMVKKYTIVELLTSVKPFYITWFFQQYTNIDKITYFDPDIMIFESLTGIENSLDVFDIILTPQSTNPINDNYLPTELHVMRTGIYNLGFIAVKRSANTNAMLQWWQSRLKDQCIIDLTRGLFVDQLWANLIPAYFDKVLIPKHPGYNMAHWNLHERKLSFSNGKYFANDLPLVFFHFSHYSPGKPNEIAAYHTRYNFETRPDLKEIYATYKNALISNHYLALKSIGCFYMNNEKKKKRKKEVENFLRQALPDHLKAGLKKVFHK